MGLPGSWHSWGIPFGINALGIPLTTARKLGAELLCDLPFCLLLRYRPILESLHVAGCKTLSLAISLRCDHCLAAIWFHVSGLLCSLGSAITFDVLLDSLARQPGLRSLQFLANAFQRVPGLVFTTEMSNRCLCHALTIVLLSPVRQ